MADAFSPGQFIKPLSDVFVSVKVWRTVACMCMCVCARARYASAAPVHVRTGAALVCRCEVAARRKGFHRDSFSRRITAIRCNWRASHKDLMHRSVSRFNVAVRRSATARCTCELKNRQSAPGLIEIRDRDRTFLFFSFSLSPPPLIFDEISHR